MTRKVCPMCGGEKSTPIYACPFAQDPVLRYLELRYKGISGKFLKDLGYFIVRECDTCSGLYHRTIISDLYTDIDLAEWKDDVDVLLAKQYRKMAGGASTVRTAQEIYSIARHFKKPVERIGVLDFGCGWGHWGMMARAFGLIDYSVEIDEDKARFVKAAGGQTIPLDQVRVMKFDYINAIGVFEHLEEPLETLKVLSSSLGPGGLIRIYVPDGRNVKASLGDEDKWESLAKGPGSLNPILPFGHRNCFTQKALIKMGECVGLTRYRWPIRELLRASVVRLAPPRRMAGQFVEPFLLSRSKTTTDLCFIKEG